MNKALRPLLAASAATAALALPLPADAAYDMFLKLDGIQGEATAKGHEKEIEVFSFSWGMARTVQVMGARGANAGRPCVSEMNLMKRMDKTTPLLMANVMSGMVIPKGKLTLRKAGGDIPLDFMVIELTSVLVSSVQESGSSGGDDTPMESISVHFTSAKATYTPQGPDGKPGSPVPASIQGADC
ncbi:MAG TPA: type VI secretion system tube protein Hcp [Usitatibacter sp.]|jgi:type VI secretion system secreted protein Hcp|nr:type VI secretion system tube protein Hcp [Usitatibacter sp.]